MLLTEFDANRQAIINPEALHEPLEGFPKIAVSCFSRLTFQRMLEMFPHELIYETSMANVAIPIYKLVIDDKAKTFMASKGYDVQFGARPLKRAIQTYLEDGLSELIISSELQTSDTISVSLNEEKGELDIKKA